MIWGWTDLGSFGSEISPPNLDKLSKEGITFTDFHVSVSCSPIRSMLLSGHDNHEAGLGNKRELLTENQKGKHIKELPADHYSSRSFTDYLVDSIRENHNDGKPFLAYLAFRAVHDPVQVPEPWLSKYRGQYDDGYESLKKRRWEAAKKLVFHHYGRVIQFLKDIGEYENTIILFLSDNRANP